MSAELRQVAEGFSYRVKSFNIYDVNGYRFHTTGYEQSAYVGGQVAPLLLQKPLILESLRQAKMGSSIMKELKKYMNSSFMVPYR